MHIKAPSPLPCALAALTSLLLVAPAIPAPHTGLVNHCSSDPISARIGCETWTAETDAASMRPDVVTTEDHVITVEKEDETIVVTARDLDDGDQAWDVQTDPGQDDWVSGVDASPDGDTIYVAIDSEVEVEDDGRRQPQADFYVLALDASSGDELWHNRVDMHSGDLTCWEDPGEIDAGPNTVFLAGDGCTALTVVAFDGSSGDIRWTGSQDVGSGPYFDIDVLPERDAVAATSQQAKDRRVTVYDADSGEMQWTRLIGGADGRTHGEFVEIVDDGVSRPLVVTGGDSPDTARLDAMLLADGSTKWTLAGSLEVDSPSFTADPAGRQIYVTGAVSGVEGTARTVAVSADDGTLTWSAEHDEPAADYQGHPVDVVATGDGPVDDHRVFVTLNVEHQGRDSDILTLGYDAGSGDQVAAYQYDPVRPESREDPDNMAVGPDSSKLFVTGTRTAGPVIYEDTSLTLAYPVPS